jgi:hypothetical protein
MSAAAVTAAACRNKGAHGWTKTKNVVIHKCNDCLLFTDGWRVSAWSTSCCKLRLASTTWRGTASGTYSSESRAIDIFPSNGPLSRLESDAFWKQVMPIRPVMDVWGPLLATSMKNRWGGMQPNIHSRDADINWTARSRHLEISLSFTFFYFFSCWFYGFVFGLRRNLKPPDDTKLCSPQAWDNNWGRCAIWNAIK